MVQKYFLSRVSFDNGLHHHCDFLTVFFLSIAKGESVLLMFSFTAIVSPDLPASRQGLPPRPLPPSPTGPHKLEERHVSMNATKPNLTHANNAHSSSSSNKSSTAEESNEKDLTAAPPSSSVQDTHGNQTTPDSAAPLTNGTHTTASKEITPPDGVFPLDSSQDNPEKLEDKECEPWVQVQRKKKSGKSESRVSEYGEGFFWHECLRLDFFVFSGWADCL